MDTRIGDLQRLMGAIGAVVLTVAQDLQKGKLGIDEQVAVGYHLSTLVRNMDKALDPIRETLREKAVHQQPEPGNVTLDSTHGPSCTVVIPQPSVQIRKDADMEALKSILGPRFKAFFDITTDYKPRPDFENRTANCSKPKEREAVLAVVKVAEGTPRVSFKE